MKITHCQAGIGLIRPIPYYQNQLFSVAPTWRHAGGRKHGDEWAPPPTASSRLPIPVIGSIARGDQRLSCSMRGSITGIGKRLTARRDLAVRARTLPVGSGSVLSGPHIVWENSAGRHAPRHGRLFCFGQGIGHHQHHGPGRRSQPRAAKQGLVTRSHCHCMQELADSAKGFSWQSWYETTRVGGIEADATNPGAPCHTRCRCVPGLSVEILNQIIRSSLA